ncbi:alcohol dehydrogenase catalytic domain-containing protein [Yinghuangia soli]|uniref:Zinc-binding dehydrogenase n=1 Tax=Yinghuangia soli TaxID=2908204 RepID=A0AA41PY01_9ACTN|nr:zinc-binding dehydrogenase [Yinghuangia soli]MCF2527677.1 zinc-binding dehydrogenase [Yinghuangia soli]
MRALVSRPDAAGGFALELAELALPEPGPGQVRVRVAAAAVNPVDLATASGALAAGGLHPPRERIGLGWDVAGVVDAVGAGVPYAVGDAVVGIADLLDVDSGTHAEYVVLGLGQVAAAPAGVDPVAAATLPLNALTAEQALDRLDLPAGATLLVTGAAGGVGGFAVELAVRRGLRVAGTATAADEALVRGLGAEWFVPREVPRLASAVREAVPGGVDGALDAAVLGGAAVLGAVRNRGAYTVLGPVPAVPLRGIATSNTWITADGPQLAALAGVAAQGGLTLRVAGTYPLAEAEEAYRRLAAGGLRGRLVLIPG